MAVGMMPKAHGGATATRLEDPDRAARLAAGIAHELRNPLAVILARVQLLRLALERPSPPDRDTLARTLATIEEQTLRASRVIENLAVFARPRPPARERLDLAELLEQVLGLFGSRLKQADVTAAVEVAPDARTLEADRAQLVTALSHLVSNALEAVSSGGRVDVRARRADGWVEIHVLDDGPGVAVADAPHIFEPFFSTKPGAAGLGLAAARTIVESHGGRLTLRAAGGPGAEFVLSLPASADGGAP
jgi:two-component system sensor histidine kinase HydH